MAQPAVDGLRVSDIGGHPLQGGGWFRSGLVFRVSGGMVGPADIAHLDSLGLRVLIDLRGEDEDRRRLVDWAAARGVRYHHEPMALADPDDFAAALNKHGRTEADGRAFLAKIYRRMLDDFSGSLVGAVTAVAQAQPAAFGCAAGKDRTGLLTALIQELLGVDRATILAGYVSQAPDPDRLLEAVATWWDWDEGDLAKPGLGGILSAVEEVMAGALDYLDERHGGAVRYFETAGLPASTVEQLRDRLVSDAPARPGARGGAGA
ncbi:MAG TPA: tyrosine-protein phosphatase [Acidimicrobiia bacterium]|nr:tyrosine-protein phosphatase [Acidimicrobiia bacterium]